MTLDDFWDGFFTNVYGLGLKKMSLHGSLNGWNLLMNQMLKSTFKI